jgi:hypothetical protein
MVYFLFLVFEYLVLGGVRLGFAKFLVVSLVSFTGRRGFVPPDS